MLNTNKDTETRISGITDIYELYALKELCDSAKEIKETVHVLADDGEWDYRWEKVFNKYGPDIRAIANLENSAWKYNGKMTIETLLKVFSDLQYLMSKSINDIYDEELRFNTAYEFLDRRYDPLHTWETVNRIKQQTNLWESIHPKIEIVAHGRYSSNQYADAVEAAFKEVIKRVKDHVRAKTNTRLDGDRAVNRAFGFENQEPLLKFNSLNGDEEKDEQRGILNLFKGIVGIRNRKAHENVVLNDPRKAFEYITLASLLMRLLDQSMDQKRSTQPG